MIARGGQPAKARGPMRKTEEGVPEETAGLSPPLA